MKVKTQQEQFAAARQVELITQALSGVAESGYWFNVRGKLSPRIYKRGMNLSAFNSLILGLHSDSHGSSTSIYTTYHDTKIRQESVLKDERSVPMYWYRWDKYVNKYNDKDIISKEDYKSLDMETQKMYKGVRQREVKSLFNIEQTTFPYVRKEEIESLKQKYGGIADRGNLTAEQRHIRSTVASIRNKINENLIPIRKSNVGCSYYDTSKDVVYMPDQKHYANYNDYVQDMFRQIITATGHRERTAREGMVMKGGIGLEDSIRYEELITELASAVKMMELGLPAKLTSKSINNIESWARQLAEDPCMIDAIECDVNNSCDIIRKAELGERIEFRGNINKQQTQDYREKISPQVTSSEGLILQDILAHGGMEINKGNFKDDNDFNSFLGKFYMDIYNKRVQSSLETARVELDQDVVDYAYTEAMNEASQIYRLASEMYPYNADGPTSIAETLIETVDRQKKTFVVVQDKETGITDVILPGGARRGGDVIMTNGDKLNYWLTPDEVMSSEARRSACARVVTHNNVGFNKDKITAALIERGAKYVRFYNDKGNLLYRPDDKYFGGKEVYTAILESKKILVTSTIDVTEAVKMATDVRFDRVQMLKDDEGKWALYLKADNEPSFCIYPDKLDTNRFFSTARQFDSIASQKIRNELAQKYYALAKANPELKKDLSPQVSPDIDVSRITKVNIYRAKSQTDSDSYKYMCVAEIRGVGKLDPKEITPLQWQRLWISDDISNYKIALAATIYSDILKQEIEDAQLEEPIKVNDFPNLKHIDEVKSKHPDAIILMRRNDMYESVRSDAEKVAEICNINTFERVNTETDESIKITTFPPSALDTYLPKLIRAGQRVAICDAIEEPQKRNNRESEQTRSGMRI